ncbi:MAG: thiolase family protein [Deltaproteobacteria bacterium]|nr:MAG: thiolase family protein [Deltaproteobacteria bacterium]
MSEQRDAVIVGAVRTAIGKANRGSLVHTRPDDMGAAVLKAVVDRVGIDPELIEDVVMGCAMPEAEQGMNVARNCVILAGLPDSVAAMTINRYCSSGLQSIWQVHTDILAGGIDVGIAGGTETMSMIPMGGNKIVPNLDLVNTRPEAYMGMGQTAENVAVKYEISREEQDTFAVESQRKALAALERGEFKEQIVPIKAYRYDGNGKKIEFVFDTDEGPRASTVEGLGKLRPAFANPKTAKPFGATVTAGNSSQMSDGASAVMLMEASKAKELGVTPLAKLHGYVTCGLDPAYMGLGPAFAVPKLMERFGKKLGIDYSDIGCVEVNEAFASQAKYCGDKFVELGIPAEAINPNGGAIALGHPLGCTGSKLTTQIVHWLRDHNKRWGIVTMCVGGGMGAAGLIENLQFKN